MQEKIQEKSIIKQNILLYLDKIGTSQYEFYKKTGITRGVLAQNNGISEDNIAKFLAHYPEVSIEWLLTGSGSMLKSGSGGGNNHINNSTNSAIVSGSGISIGKNSVRGVSQRQVSEPAVDYDNRPTVPVAPAASGDADVEIDKLRALVAEKDALLLQKDALLKAKDDIIRAKDDIIQLLMTQLAAK